jgi:tRNA threonylcarbamoyladenosine biosynthesis protein TsaB
MVKVLAFDCAGRRCAVGVAIDGRIAAERVAAMERGQAEALLPMIGDVLGAAGLRFAALDLIAVTIGPGSFTGLRIGLAAARGLALASGLPCIGVTSLAAVAAGVAPAQRGGRPLVVALDTKRAELFLQCFAPDGPEIGAAMMVAPDLAEGALPPGPLLLAGDAASRLAPWLGARARVGERLDLPRPGDIARLALQAWRPGEPTEPPRPLYLRAPDTSLPRASWGLARGAG